jgi:monofunctional biosynthetic peptidoglycan transglycosylase
MGTSLNGKYQSDNPSSHGSALNDIELDYADVKRRQRRIRRYLIIGVLFLSVFWFVPPVYKLFSGSVTVTRWDRKLGETRAEVGPGRPGWIKAKAISKHVLHAFVAAEDGKFYTHSGFDLEQIEKSIETNLKKKRYARGASTISQQVIKMAFLSREKSLLRKAREAVGTVLMEALLPKDKILEWYINLAEFGDGVYGIAEGCEHYFRTKPDQLTIEQSVHLALVLPSPNSWSRGLRAKTLTPFGHKRYASILNNMKLSGYITKGQWQTALSRGDFGRPINGYTKYLANEEKISNDCTAESCGELETDPIDDPETHDISPPVNNETLGASKPSEQLSTEPNVSSAETLQQPADITSLPIPSQVTAPATDASSNMPDDAPLTPSDSPSIETETPANSKP